MPTGYVYPGKVVKLDPAGPLVQVPLVGGDALFGPMPTSVPDLAVGERVIVGALGSSANQLHILGRTVGRVPTLSELPDITAALDALDVRVDALVIDQDTDEGVLASHGTRLTAIETLNTTQNSRLTTVEGRATTLEGRATTIEGAATTLTGRVTATEGVANAATTAANNAGNAATTLRADTAGKVTTKGDLLVATGAGVLARQAVGTDGLALVADSTQAGGLSYAERRGASLLLAGAAAATRWVGSTAGGPPTSGTFLVGDWVLDRATGGTWACTVAGTPGTWVNTAITKPLGHAGRTAGFQPNNTGVYTGFDAAQVLRGGVLFSSATDSLTVPKAGVYRVSAKAYFTGGTAYQGAFTVSKNSDVAPTGGAVLLSGFTAKTTIEDYTGYISELVALAANDVLRLWTAGASNTWGTDGYNGSYLEVEYMDQ